MKTRTAFGWGAASGAALVALGVAVWLGWTTGSNRPHTHRYGRWREAAPMISKGEAFPVNERYCIICGWRDIRLNLGGSSAP